MTTIGRLVLLPSLLLVALVGCSREPPPEANLRNHRCDRNNYALNLPQGWLTAESTAAKETFFLPLPDHGHKLVVTVLVERAPAARDLQGYLKCSREQFSRFKGYEERQAAVVQHAGGREAYLIDAVSPGDLDPSATAATDRRRFRQYGFLLGGRQYLITAVVPAEDSDRWIAEIDPILNSFLIW